MALGLYFLLYPPDDEGCLFPGKEQKQRFSKSLARVLKSEGLIERVRQLGYDPADFGTQSLRKGSSTFASSGTTDAPSQMAINLRAGWTMTKIEKTYFRFEKAGDQYVGRTVAGLPIHSAEFSILPPLWDEKSPAAQQCAAQVMQVCFPQVPEALHAVVKNCVASVVYHAPWLRENLPSNHRLWASRLFASFNVHDLHAHVVCGLPTPDGDLRATGVPAHVAIKVEMDNIRKKQEALVEAVTEFRQDFGETLRQGLNEFAVSQGHMTFDKFKDLLDQHLASLDQRVQTQISQGNTVLDGAASAAGAILRQERKTYLWGGMLHLVPEDFELPSVTVSQAFTLWAAGCIEKDLPPFRFLTPHDMPCKNAGKRLSDFRVLMAALEEHAKGQDECWPRDGQGRWKSSLTPGEAQVVFDHVSHTIALPDATTKGRTRRTSQMLWSSHLKVWKWDQKEQARQKQGKKRVAREEVLEEMVEKPEQATEQSAEASVDLEEEGVERDADYDVTAAYKRLVAYCAKKLGLYENAPIEGDGACLFRTAAVQLSLTCPEIGPLSHEAIREACVEWVFERYHNESAELLVLLGYDGWEDWREQMRQESHYGDELCVEAIAALYDVRILLAYCADGEPSHRFIGEPQNRTIFMGNVGDYHFYCFRPVGERPGQRRKNKCKSLR